MIVEVENLGPIKKEKVELKPLTVFVGPNNTGKSYLAYLILKIISDRLIKIHMFEITSKLRLKENIIKLTDQDFNELLEKDEMKITIDLKEILLNNESLIRLTIKRLNEKLNVLVQESVRDYWEFIGSDVESPFKDIRASIEIPNLDTNKNLN